MALEDGLLFPLLDASGRIVQSPDPQVSAKSFFSLELKGTVAGDGTPVSVQAKIQDGAGVDIESEVFGGKYYADANAHPHDYMALEVVDVDDVLGYGAGTVLGSYGRFTVAPGHPQQIILPSKKDVLAGLYYRITYFPQPGNTATINFWGNLLIRK